MLIKSEQISLTLLKYCLCSKKIALKPVKQISYVAINLRYKHDVLCSFVRFLFIFLTVKLPDRVNKYHDGCGSHFLSLKKKKWLITKFANRAIKTPLRYGGFYKLNLCNSRVFRHPKCLSDFRFSKFKLWLCCIIEWLLNGTNRNKTHTI